MLADAWTRLVRGGADRRSPFHTPVVGTVDRDGDIAQRVMVLRKCDSAAATLRFHTDVRSAKSNHLDRRVSVIGYDSSAKVQIRLSGIGALHREGAIADAAWQSSIASSRRCYLASPGPGTESDVPTSGLAADIEAIVPDIALTEAGRINFAVLLVTIDKLEWLYLAHDGHRRARFVNSPTGWQGVWLVP